MWIPRPIYEALPVVYPAIGIFSVAALGPQTLSLLSAALLFGASAVIWVLRRRYRANQRVEMASRVRRTKRRRA